MVQHHFSEIVGSVVVVIEEVASDSTADIEVLHAFDGSGLAIEVDQWLMVALQIATTGGMDAAIACATAAQLLVATVHAVHIGRRATQVGQHSIEPFGRGHHSHLVEDGLLASRHHLLALMGGDGTERAASKAASMDIDGVLDHLKSWNGTASLVFGMRNTHIGQVEAVVQLVGCHRWFGGIDDDGGRGSCEL